MNPLNRMRQPALRIPISRNKLLWLPAGMFCFVLASAATSQEYDPLQIGKSDLQEPIDLTVDDQQRQREIPVRVYLPATSAAAPVVLFSHGLGGSRRGCGYGGRHWSARGFVVVAMQHAGSDESVWRNVPIRERRDALKNSTSIRTTLARYQDVKVVIDQLEAWNAARDHQLHGRLDLEHIGMSGHSYGAITTQGVSGQSFPQVHQRFTDERIDAALMLSPNSPRRAKPEAAFGKVAIPWMLMTGTKDTSPINDTTVEDRLAVYPALPDSIDKYELVLHDAEHRAFSDGEGRGRQRDPNHHRVILALSTAFWDAHLRGNKQAEAWLHGNSPRRILADRDRWQLSDP